MLTVDEELFSDSMGGFGAVGIWVESRSGRDAGGRGGSEEKDV